MAVSDRSGILGYIPNAISNDEWAIVSTILISMEFVVTTPTIISLITIGRCAKITPKQEHTHQKSTS